MKKTKKQMLAEYLQAHQKYLSAQGVMELSNSKNLGVQVKTLDSNGTFVIKFSSSDPWINPTEWLHNYKATAKARYEDAASVYHSLFPPEDSVMSSAGSLTTNDKAYGSLKSSLNVQSGDVWMKHLYPSNLERFKTDVIRVMDQYPKIRGVDLLIALTIGYSGMASFEILQEAKEFVASELRKRQ